jgi:hypothetical protein
MKINPDIESELVPDNPIIIEINDADAEAEEIVHADSMPIIVYNEVQYDHDRRSITQCSAILVCVIIIMFICLRSGL